MMIELLVTKLPIATELLVTITKLPTATSGLKGGGEWAVTHLKFFFSILIRIVM